MSAAFSGTQILLGVTGSIAIHRALDLASELRKDGARLTVIMTESAQELVRPVTFQTIAGGPVLTSLFRQDLSRRPEHIAIADDTDLFVVAPATANILGKLACGIADDLLTTTALAVTCPVLICPAMNPRMLAHPAVQANIERLRERGCLFVDPAEGVVACGDTGAGRLAPAGEILSRIREILAET